MERSGQLLGRVMRVFGGVTSANTDPTLQKVQEQEAPKLAAHEDAIHLNSKLFARVKTVYNERATLHLLPPSSCAWSRLTTGVSSTRARSSPTQTRRSSRT